MNRIFTTNYLKRIAKCTLPAIMAGVSAISCPATGISSGGMLFDVNRTRKTATFKGLAFIIPDGVKSIKTMAFKASAIESIVIP